MKQLLPWLLAGVLPAVALAQTHPAAQTARQWRQQHERAIIDEFATFLKIPNVTVERELDVRFHLQPGGADGVHGGHQGDDGRFVVPRTIIIPIANHDNNQHSVDENLRIQNLWDGIELMAALLTM